MDIYYSANLFPLLPLISAFICPIFVAEHLCNVGQFDIWLRKYKTCKVLLNSIRPCGEGGKTMRGTYLSIKGSGKKAFQLKKNRRNILDFISICILVQ